MNKVGQIIGNKVRFLCEGYSQVKGLKLKKPFPL